MAQPDVSSRVGPRPGAAGPAPPAAAADPAPPAPRAAEAPGAKPAKTRARRVLNALVVYACVAPAVILYEMATAPTCSSSGVENLVKDIVESKLLHLRKFSVALSDVKVLDRDVFGDRRCSAEVDVDGKALPRRVEYRWTKSRNHLDTVYAKLRP